MLINDHLELIIPLYITFSVIAIISIIRNIYKSHQITIMSMCCIMYIIVLCVLPALILYEQKGGMNVTSTISYENEESVVTIAAISYKQENCWTFYIQFILTTIGYLLFNFGYRIRVSNSKNAANIGNQKIVLTATIFSIISLISLFLWSSGYNGISGLLKNANGIRAGWVISTNSYTFFKHFVPLALLASWMLFNTLTRNIIKTPIRKLGVIMLLICDISISSVYIQANDGRMLLAVYILLFFIIYLKYLYEVKSINITPIILRFSLVLAGVIIILINADDILRYLRGDNFIPTEKSGILDTISNEFSFIITGTQTALLQWESGNNELMFYNDIVNGLFAWLPSSLKPAILEDVWDYNTRLINSVSYGQSPTSIVAQSLYDLSWLGIILIPFLYGILVKKAEKVLLSYKNNIFYETVYVALGFYLCKGIPYFSLYNIMINTFFIFIGVSIYTVLQKIKL